MFHKRDWSAFRSAVAELNQFMKPCVLRRYQADLLDGNQLCVISPISGNRLVVSGSVLLGNRIAYLASAEEKLWLLVGAIRQGFPIAELITEADGRRWQIDRDWPSEGIELAKETLATLQSYKVANLETGPDTPVTLQIGMNNFAHHLWNELSALDEWLENAPQAAIDRLVIVSTAEPLGPLDEIFPRLSGVSIIRDRPTPTLARMAAASILVRTGSCIVSKSISATIRKFSRDTADYSRIAHHIRLLEHAWPRVWFSIRDGTRSADNLDDFIFVLTKRILTHYQTAAIILDAVSYPFGFFDDDRMKMWVDGFKLSCDSANEFIDRLRHRIADELGEMALQRLITSNGNGLNDAIHIGQFCDYYVCHAGTLQHKIGWFHRLPGIIHLPAGSRAKADWHGAQVEDGLAPDILPDFLIEKTTQGKRVGDRNFNYRITDVERAAEHVSSCMLRQLGRRS